MPRSPQSDLIVNPVSAFRPTPKEMLGQDMSASDLPEITLTTRDVERLAALIGDFFRVRDKDTAFLAGELDRATVVDPDDIGEGVVTMRSLVDFWSGESGRLERVMLVYPAEASQSENKISVLTPVGTALLGLTEGQRMPYAAVDGNVRQLTLHRVLFQPEANGMAWL